MYITFLTGNSVSKLLDKLSESASRKCVLDMVSFYKEVIKDLPEEVAT